MRERGSEEREAVAAAVARFRAGIDPEAAAKVIFDRYFRPLCSFFVKRGTDRSDARDLAQETLSRVYTNMADYREEARFDTWLFRIAVNVWKNAVRDSRTLKRGAPTVSLDDLRSPADPDAPPHPAADPVDRGASPERRTEQRELEMTLREALERLPERMRECAMLKLIQERSHNEIAVLMGISVSTVKSQLKEARPRLRLSLGPLLDREWAADS